MQTIQQTAPISDMRKDQEAVLSMMEKGPVILMARSRPKAVIVDPDQWDTMARRLQMLETIAEARRIEARTDANNSWVSGDEMRRIMAERGVNVGD